MDVGGVDSTVWPSGITYAFFFMTGSDGRPFLHVPGGFADSPQQILEGFEIDPEFTGKVPPRAGHAQVTVGR